VPAEPAILPTVPARTARSIACAVLAAPALFVSSADAALPLGPRSLEERRTVVPVARGVTWTHVARGERSSSGPWRVDALTVDRRALSGRFAAVLSNGRVPGRETITAMARRARAVAGVNGGFFTTGPPLEGDPVGALVVDGELVSEPLAGRTALLVPRSPLRLARVAALRFDGAVELDGRRRLLDGIDRLRGLVPGCGGRGGDRPTQRSSSALTCVDRSELVLLTGAFGPRTAPSGAGAEAVVRDGAVVAARRASGAIPRDGYVLSGSGDGAGLLRAHARPGVPVRLRLALRAGRRRLDPERYAAIVGAGPRLLRRRRVRVPAAAEGFPRSFSHRRHPRTLAGVRADGRLLLVTIDGRRPGYSVGATLPEAARVMRSLGAREAVNLDGGGSTTMSAGRRLLNRPSDAGGERPVSDGLFVLP